MRILVTGGAGMIGSNLVERLLKENNEVTVYDNLTRGKFMFVHEDSSFKRKDLTRPQNLKDYSDFDVIFHLAAKLGGVNYVYTHQSEMYRDNILMNINILEICRKLNIPLLFTSTACVYPVEKQVNPYSHPLKETDVRPYHPESGYGWAKLYTEFMCEEYIKKFDMKIGIVRMFNVFGKNEDISDNSHVIPMLIRKAIEYPGKPFIIWGSGTQTRSFIYVDDAIEGILLTAKYGMNKGPINIGTEERVTINKLAKEIIKISKKEIKIEHDLSKPEGVRGRAANINKARKILKWNPRVSLEKGLRLTYKWVKENYDKLV